MAPQGEALEQKVTARAHGRSDGQREGYQKQNDNRIQVHCSMCHEVVVQDA